MKIPEDVVCSAMSQTLEEMYFCTGTWTGAGALQDSPIGARVAFSGAFRGEFKVAATPDFAARLAADFLASDVSQITAPQTLALVQELANVACGATLSAWLPKANFNFSVPSSLAAGEVSGEWSHRFCVSGLQPELAIEIILSGES